MLSDPSGSMGDKPTPSDLPAFGGKTTDIVLLLKGLISTEVYTDHVVVIATDGDEPNTAGVGSSLNDQFLRLLQEFDLRLVRTRSVVESSDEFPGLDSTRRKTIEEQGLGEE